MKKGSPYLVDILRNVVATGYKYTLYNAAGLPVTFDFSSKDIGKLGVHYEFSPSFILKAKMGLYDSKFSSHCTIAEWIEMCQKDNGLTWDIERLLENHVYFYKDEKAWANQFPMSQKSGFVEFVHRCLTEFPRAFDRDVLDRYRYKGRAYKGGVLLHEVVSTLVRTSRPPRVGMALFSRSGLNPSDGFISDCHVDYGTVMDIFFEGDYRYEKYEPAVVEYLKKKLEME